MGTPFAAASVAPLMWVGGASGSNGFLAKLTPGGRVIQTFVSQQQPIALAAIQFDDLPDPRLYFVDMSSEYLFSFDPATGSLTTIAAIGPVSNGIGPQALLFDGTSLWISNAGDNTVRKVDLNAGSQATCPVGNMPLGLAFDGTNIWVANVSDNTVTKLRASDGQILQTIATGTSPGFIAFDGADIWVTNMDSNTLTQIRAGDGTVVGTFPTGSNPAGVVFDGAHIWVANSGINTLSRY